MVSRLSWIAFVPFAIAAIVIELIRNIYITEDNPLFYGMNDIQLAYLAIACVVVILLFTILFVSLDRKIAPYYIPRRNIVAGCLGVLLAFVFAFEGANSLFNLFESGSFDIFGFVDGVLTLFSAVVFIVIGFSHFAGNGGVQSMALLYVVPAIWSAIKLIRIFLSFTTQSMLNPEVNSGDVNVTLLIAFIFLTLFLFNFAMVISTLKGKSPVKMTIVYAFPAAAALLAYSAFAFSKIVIRGEVVQIFSQSSNGGITFSFGNKVEVLLLALYILVFLIELTVFVKQRDEIEIFEHQAIEETVQKELTPLVEETNDQTDIIESDIIFEDDELVITDIDHENDDRAESYLEKQDVEGFIYIQGTGDTATEEDSSYGKLGDEDASDYITNTNTLYEDEVTEEAEEVYNERLDDIDKLILELTESEADNKR